jgi:hypothetical protein
LVYLIYDDEERFNGRHQRKDNLICHSEAGEESPDFLFKKIKKETNLSDQSPLDGMKSLFDKHQRKGNLFIIISETKNLYPFNFLLILCTGNS